MRSDNCRKLYNHADRGGSAAGHGLRQGKTCANEHHEDIYSHLLKSSDKTAAKTLEQLFD